MMRFAFFGAVGFGVGGTVAGACWPLAFVTSGTSALLFILSGAVGGASLGLALGDRRRTKLLALLGTLGFTLGGIVALVIGFGFLSVVQPCRLTTSRSGVGDEGLYEVRLFASEMVRSACDLALPPNHSLRQIIPSVEGVESLNG